MVTEEVPEPDSPQKFMRIDVKQKKATTKPPKPEKPIPENESAGCKLKRELRQIRQESSAKAATKTQSELDADNSFERLLLCKRPRGKKEPEYETYKTMTRAAIHKLNGEIKKAEKNGDWAESKKLRNMKSSTESRLIKRAAYERTKA